MGIHSQEQVRLLTECDPDSAFTEAYETLYANIRLNWQEQATQHHTLLLTTPKPYAEQAVITANAAIVAAQNGTPTILVDADLHHPVQHRLFNISNNAGLYELLQAETVTPQKIDGYLCKTFVPDLRLLTAGNPAEGAAHLLSTRLAGVITAMQNFLAETEKRPGLIIFHSPAVLSGPDASFIGVLVEQTLLTISTRHTTRALARQAQEQLQHAHVPIAGIVVFDS